MMPGWLLRLLARVGITDLASLREMLSAGVATRLQTLTSGALALGQGAASFLLALAVVLYLTFFLLRDGRRLAVRIGAYVRTIKTLIPIEERGASGIQIGPEGSRAFIACPRDHYLAVVDLPTLRMAGKIDTGREPDGLAWWQP